MKTISTIKVFLIAAISCIMVSNHAQADNDRPTTLNKMPAKAQEFVAKYFPGTEITLAKEEGYFLGKTYDIIFKDGNQIEFNRNGEWTKVSCRTNYVPDKVIPAPILQYLQQNYPDAKVKEIEKDDRNYELNLTNRVELKFNSSFQLIDADF